MVGLAIASSGCAKRPGMDHVGPLDPCTSLAGYEQDAPWPTECRCPSRACYTPAVGPTAPVLAWRLEGPDWERTYGGDTTGQILISAAGALYVIRNHDELVAVSRNGDELWSYAPLPGEFSGFSGPTAIGRDGTLYVHTFANILAITPQGQLKWEVEPAVGQFGMISLGEDDTLYTIDGVGTVVALSADGDPLWTLPCPNIIDCWTPARGPGGGVVQIGFTGWDEGYAQQVLWRLDPAGGRSEITTIEAQTAGIGGFDARDTLYIIGRIVVTGGDIDRVYALGADGTELWRRDYDSRVVRGPSIDTDGRLYFTRTVEGVSGVETAHLEALNADGTVRWDKPIAEGLSGRPIIDADGNLYLGATLDGQCAVLSLNRDGTERWRFGCSGDRAPILGSMDIDGTLYAVDESGLFAVSHETP